MIDPVRVGLIGCGTISRAYMKAAPTFPWIKFVACADLIHSSATKLASEFDLEALSVDALLARADIEVVLNLTIPKAHVEVNTAALNNGKHAYCEKPFGLDLGSAKTVLDLAAAKGLRVGCAPDTFLGGGHQTVRNVIDRGAIGRPVAGTAFMMSHGVEMWHPSPVFYYEPGGGPLFDMGPYYITALVNSLGPVSKVAGMTGKAFEERLITSKPLAGEVIDVQVDTHSAGTLLFENGAIVSLVMSFDIWRHTNHNIEIHGTDASISVPDPNGFGGVISTATKGKGWEERVLTHGYTSNMRSIGLADMCLGIRQNRQHRASGELATHVVEVMAAFEKSSRSNEFVDIQSRPAQPEAMPVSLDEGVPF